MFLLFYKIKITALIPSCTALTSQSLCRLPKFLSCTSHLASGSGELRDLSLNSPVAAADFWLVGIFKSHSAAVCFAFSSEFHRSLEIPMKLKHTVAEKTS